MSNAGGGQLTVYASWNGATDVASWQLLAGNSPDSSRRWPRPTSTRLRDRDRGHDLDALCCRAGRWTAAGHALGHLERGAAPRNQRALAAG